MPDSTFFYHVLRPGRYLGGETGVVTTGDGSASRTVAWCYPGRYEDAMADPAWRRGYYQLARQRGLRCLRSIEFAKDVWQRLSAQELPPFSIDGGTDLRQVDALVFWVADSQQAAHIPSLLRRLAFGSTRPRLGVLVDGYWIPRFLVGHVDWFAPAPAGWLPAGLAKQLAETSDPPDRACSETEAAKLDSYWAQDWSAATLEPVAWPETPRWISNIDIGDDFADVELLTAGEDGRLHARHRGAVVADALDALRTTGIDGIRFCGTGEGQSSLVVGTLTDLARVTNTRYLRARWPALTAAEYESDWTAFKPHLIKPGLRLILDKQSDVQQLADIGRRALNSGWHALTLVLRFDSFAQVASILSKAGSVILAWQQAAGSFADKRPLRIEYLPAAIDRWVDAPSEPCEEDVRRLVKEFRRFKEDMTRPAAVGLFRIEDVMARNWLAAADGNIWEALAELDLADPNNDEANHHDWFSWIRQVLGSQGAPRKDFLRAVTPVPSEVATSENEPGGKETTVVAPGDHMFGRRKTRPAFTRRMAAPSRLRMRAQFSKGAQWRLYSHLDTVRAIERAIRRAQLPVAYSEGFHPRMKLSFGPPLPFGIVSASEFFDLVLTADYEPVFAERLARALPEGIIFKDACGLAANVPSLSDTINEAVFRGVIPLGISDAQTHITEFLQKPHIEFRRPDRPGRKPIDPRKNLRETSIEDTPEGTLWNLRLRIGGEGSIRPADWATLLFDLSPEQLAGLVIERTALLIRHSGGDLRTPLESP